MLMRCIFWAECVYLQVRRGASSRDRRSSEQSLNEHGRS